MPNIAIIKTYPFISGKKEKIKEYISKELKRTRKGESFIDNKSMKLKIVDNKSDAMPPITITQEISTSTNNTKSSSELNNDSAILKSIKLLFVNLNLVNDEINNVLTEDVVANKILMQSLYSLSVKHRELCLFREECLQNGVKYKATSKIIDRLEELESAEKDIRSALIEMSNIKIQAALGLDILTLNVQRKKICRLCVLLKQLNCKRYWTIVKCITTQKEELIRKQNKRT